MKKIENTFVVTGFVGNNAEIRLSFLLLCPTHLRNRTNSSSKRHSLFIGSNIPKDEE